MTARMEYKRILVPLDGSGWAERAIPYAADLARTHDAELALLHVYTPPFREFTDQLVLAAQENQMDALRQNVEQYLAGLRNGLRAQGVKAESYIVEAPGAARGICNFVENQDVDVIVMSTHGRSGFMRWLFGGVTHKVLQGVRVPVMLIYPDES